MKNIVYMFTNFQGKKYIGSKKNCIVENNKIIDKINSKIYWSSSTYNGFKKSLKEMPYKLDILFETDDDNINILEKENEYQVLYDVLNDDNFVNKSFSLDYNNNWTKGKSFRVYNNGEKEIHVIKGEKIPEGFERGRLKININSQKETLKMKRRKLYHNVKSGIEVYVFEGEKIPEGFVEGMSPKRKKVLSNKRQNILKNKILYVDDKKNMIYLNENDEIPFGYFKFEKGSLKNISNLKGTKKYINNDGVIKFFIPGEEEPGFFLNGGKSSIKGKIKYHNPITKKEIYINENETPPSDFIKGGLKMEKRKNTFYNIHTYEKGMFFNGEEPPDYKKMPYFSKAERLLIKNKKEKSND